MEYLIYKKEVNMSRRTGRIYLITNTITHEQYIGQTRNSIKYRFSDHKKRTSKKYKRLHTKLQRSIYLYGEENFELALVKDDIKLEELDYYERYYIKTFNTYESGLNSNSGGSGRAPYERDRSSGRKYGDDLIIQVTYMLEEGKEYHDISKDCNVGTDIISDINVGRLGYGLIRYEYPIVDNSTKIGFTDKELISIHNKIISGEPFKRIAKDFNTSTTTISKINRGENLNNKLKGYTYPLVWGYSANQKMSKEEVAEIVLLLKSRILMSHIKRYGYYSQPGDLNKGKAYANILEELGITTFPIQKERLTQRESEEKLKKYQVHGVL